eukprot:TRINITY_DN828_c0_g1_i1.p4 TRINITY_DN828_c0_g1~~TRINITY_DN828_c0_g1_i1.p4  ORF type:complete len:114 (-),score=3.04 TRINITY_DN828_c0_g1_i1:722-1063(-)
MSSYFGFQTTENKVKWGIFIGFCILGVVFLISYFVEAGNCTFYETSEGTEVDWDDSSCTAAGWLLWLAIISLIVCSIPVYMMCCCTSRPNESSYNSVPYGAQTEKTPIYSTVV